MTYRDLYEKGKRALAAAGIAEADVDARLLLEYVCGTNRNTLLVHGDMEVEESSKVRYEELMEKRSKRIPLQHLTGTQEFMGLEFTVNENVLIPRQDTEILVEEVLQNVHDGMRILDMCTGSGCILLSILKYRKDCQGLAVDISEKALEVAKTNAVRLLGEECVVDCFPEFEGDGTCIRFLQSDLFDKVDGRYEIIVSNPPYIRTDVIDTLMPEVKDHEPGIALDGSADGLSFYRRIVQECKEFLWRGGMLFFEIGHDQGQEVKDLMEANGFLEVQVIKDYGGLDRVVFGTLGFEG